MSRVNPFSVFSRTLDRSRRILRLHRRVVAFSLSLVLGPIAAHAGPSASDQDSLTSQFQQFLAWFPGRYDSALQTRLDALNDVPEAERNYRRHSIFRRVDLPAFGDVVFYAEQYRDGDPDKVYRQRIYQLSIDEARQAIRLRVHVPEATQPLRGAYRDPAMLDHMAPETTTVWPGCDLWWTREGQRFRGALEPGACRFTSEAFGQEIVLEEYLLLGVDDIQFADRGLALDGTYLFGMRGDVPNISRRVRPFLCGVRLDGSDAVRWIHDQGGRIELGDRALSLQRWNVTDGNERYDRGLQLSLLDATERVLATAQAETGATFIELSDDGVQARCRHAPDRVFDDGR